MGIEHNDLIIKAYDAAVAPLHWEEVLERCRREIGAVGGLFISFDNLHTENSSWNMTFSAGVLAEQSEALELHRQKFWQYEQEAFEHIAMLEKQTMIVDNEFWTDEKALRQRPDYLNTAENFGFRRRLAARLNGDMRWLEALTFQFSLEHDDVPAGVRDTLRPLLCHFAKAAELGKTFMGLQAKYKAVLAALDHVSVGLCVVLSNGEVIVSNLEADRVLDENGALRLSRFKQLHCLSDDIGRELDNAIARAASTAAGEDRYSEALIAIPRQNSTHPLLVEVAPLRDTGAEIGPSLTGALVTLIDPDNPRPFNTESMALAYKLTPAETEVCKLLVDGWTNSDIAESRNTGIETVKAQASSILAKTKCRRRSDLIRLAIKTAPPVT